MLEFLRREATTVETKQPVVQPQQISIYEYMTTANQFAKFAVLAIGAGVVYSTHAKVLSVVEKGITAVQLGYYATIVTSTVSFARKPLRRSLDAMAKAGIAAVMCAVATLAPEGMFSKR